MSITQHEPPSGVGPERGESVIDALLLMHQDPNQVPMLIGEPHVLSLNGFILGYKLCLLTRGISDWRHVCFREWLREVKQELPLEGWYMKYLQDSGGDHLQAIHKFLDRVAEFHALGEPDIGPMGEVPPQPSAPSRVRGVESVIDMLLRIRQEFSRAPMYIGELHVLSLSGFIHGFRSCLSRRGNPDDRYNHFLEWLHDFKREPLQEDWWVKFLQNGGGDHALAIRMFLDRVAEYHARQEHGAS